MAPTPPRPRPRIRPRSSGAATQAGLFDSAHAPDDAVGIPAPPAAHPAQPTTSPAALARQFTALPPDWHAVLAPFTAGPVCASLCDFVDRERAAGKTIYPAEVFRSLHLTRAQDVKVVILGQDPYHGDDHGRPQAHGLAFSVPPGVRPPPSLKNIFKEQAASLDLPIPSHGCLDAWARQGVLLLNTVLTVEAGLAASHAKRGWEPCTDTLLTELAKRYDGLVFMLWGAHAQAKRPLLNPQRHTILEAPHPSPLSAYRGFLGCGHFVKANAALVAAGRTPIDWGLPAGV